ncbi:FadR/GntR family transcriptional regulator [Limnobaculum parvum]|uniref:FadR family transcriptional regulator n=1 Tax=Limnobaculum parvum TaxID=2172103 RepID=A0A2Y9TZE5_9GAMM|nr:FadR/GntR family transcriptional regulator [Limnobaculum parvum]AWH88754.1 FadR family transcriptional regulator [Limnobaculum parvum]
MTKTTAPSMAESLTRDLAIRIMRGDLSQVPSLPGENELALQYQVSRTTIRNALQVLSAKGMVSIQPKRRSVVTPREHWNFLDSEVLLWLTEGGMEQEMVEQLIVTRLIFEPNVAALAATNATGRDLAAMEDACHLMSDGQQQNSRELFERGDLAFHLALLRASHNPFLLSLSNALSSAMSLSFKQTLEDDVRLTKEAVTQHVVLLDAIRLKQVDTAKQRMRDILLKAARKRLQSHQPEIFTHID